MKITSVLESSRNTGSHPHELGDWIEEINRTWSRNPASVLDLGRLMCRARHSLAYGAWSEVWRTNKLPFGKRKGEMLVVIGEGLGGLDAQNSARLPASWNTLYVLARLGRPTVELLIRQRRICPDTTLRHAGDLLTEFRPGPSRTKVRSKVASRLKHFARFVRSGIPDWSPQERRSARDVLLALAGSIPFENDVCCVHASRSPNPIDGACPTSKGGLTL